MVDSAFERGDEVLLGRGLDGLNRREKVLHSRCDTIVLENLDEDRFV